MKAAFKTTFGGTVPGPLGSPQKPADASGSGQPLFKFRHCTLPELVLPCVRKPERAPSALLSKGSGNLAFCRLAAFQETRVSSDPSQRMVQRCGTTASEILGTPEHMPLADRSGLFIPEQGFLMSCGVPGLADQLVGVPRFTLERKSVGVA